MIKTPKSALHSNIRFNALSYTELRELTPIEMCIVGSCPSIYEAKRGGEEVYLIIGKFINPSAVGLGKLEEKIREDESLIEVPRRLIGNKKVY